jgi:hypothetical protein
MRFLKVLLICFLVSLPLAASAEYNSIDDIAKDYNDEVCKGCHSAIHKEWKESFHSQSVLHSLPGMKGYITTGIKKEWGREVTKADLMKCFHCHVPQLYDASEALVKKVADLVVAAVDEQDAGKKDAAKKELAKLNVSCMVCHNKVVNRPSAGWLGKPEKDTMYGPKKVSAPHKTAQSTIIQSPIFCGQCHGVYNPPDSDVIMCNTLYDSYLNAYVSHGGQKTCQECHMKEKKRGHSFPGSYVADMVKDGLEFEAEARGYKHLSAGKWVPKIIVTANIYNRSGHRTPDG